MTVYQGEVASYFQSGLAAARPPSPTVATNAVAIYYATDTAVAYYWNGTAWVAQSGTANSVMGASGVSHAAGLAPDPGVTAGTTRYLREDATWVTPPAGGTPSFTWITKTANYTALTTDTNILGDATAGAITVTLPTAVGGTWRITIKKKDASANAVNVAMTGGQTLDGSAGPLAITTRYSSVTCVGDGANVWIE